MIGERRVYEWLLPLERFHGAATGLPVVVERRLNQLWKQLRDGAQPRGGSLILPIPWLSEHKLPTSGMISEIKPIRNTASPTRHFFRDGSPCPAAINTSDQNIDAIHVGARAEVLRYRMPVKTPE